VLGGFIVVGVHEGELHTSAHTARGHLPGGHFSLAGWPSSKEGSFWENDPMRAYRQGGAA
jgi:hypothetical protein